MDNTYIINNIRNGMVFDVLLFLFCFIIYLLMSKNKISSYNIKQNNNVR